MPELIPSVDNRGHQVSLRDWLVDWPAKHDWNASLGRPSGHVRAHDFMAFVAPESEKGRFPSFDIAIRR